jgi:hypothetical protein
VTHRTLRIYRADGRPRYRWLRHGRAGNAETLQEMARLVREDVSTDIGLQNFAEAILRAYDVRGSVFGGSMREVAAIFDYVKYDPASKRGVIFRQDPAGGYESIQDARATIEAGFGDCDDFAVTLATLLGVVGYVTRFVVSRVDPQTEGFDHVYVEVLAPSGKKWIALDASNEKAVVGWEFTPALERRTYPVFADAHGAAELQGFKSFFKKLGKGALKVAPIGLSFVPGAGAVAMAAKAAAGQAISTAQGAVDARAAGGGSKKQKGARAGAGVGSNPSGQFVKYADADTIYRVSDGHAFASPAEFFAAGGAGDFSNISGSGEATPAGLGAKAATGPARGAADAREGGGATGDNSKLLVYAGLGAGALWLLSKFGGGK